MQRYTLFFIYASVCAIFLKILLDCPIWLAKFPLKKKGQFNKLSLTDSTDFADISR